MNAAQVHELVDKAWAADAATADLATARRLRAALGAREMTVAAAMERHSVFPEKHVAEAAMVPLAEAGRIVAAAAASEIPALAEACARGEVTARHVDAFAKVLKNVSAPVAIGCGATPPGWWISARRCRRRGSLDCCGVRPRVSSRPVMTTRGWNVRSGRCGCGRSSTPRGWDVGSLIGIPARSPISSTGWMNASRRCSIDLVTKGGLVATRPRILVVRRSDDGELRVDWGRHGVELPDAELAKLARRSTSARNTRLANRD